MQTESSLQSCAREFPSIFKAYTELHGTKFIFIWEDGAALRVHSDMVTAVPGARAGGTAGDPLFYFHGKAYFKKLLIFEAMKIMLNLLFYINFVLAVIYSSKTSQESKSK